MNLREDGWGAPVPGRVSVVMLTLDRFQFIGPAIESVRIQEYDEWELIVVQDGDNQWIKMAMADYQLRDARIRYFCRPTLGSIGSAINFALATATGEYMAILDDDDRWTDPRKLSMQVQAMAGNRRLACIGGGAVVVDCAGVEKLRYFKPLADQDCRRRPLLANPIIHSTAMFRMAALKTVSGYDESIQEYQDWDLVLRLMRTGTVENLPKVLAEYRVWNGSSSTSKGIRNAKCAVAIVWRHRKDFPGSTFAMMVAWAYLCISLLPHAVRRPLFECLSRLKKRFFSSA